MTTPENDGTPSASFTRRAEDQQLSGDEPGPLLTVHAALVLVAGVLIASAVGALTYLSAGNAAGAVLAGLTAGAASAPVLHKLIGR